MAGIVVVAHDNIAQEMVSVTKKIIPDANRIIGVSIISNDTVESNRQKIAASIASVDKGDGILILTDMFGGTPSNLCLSFLGKPNIEVISGVNLPILIKLASNNYSKSFEELITYIQEYGQKNIVIASRILQNK